METPDEVIPVEVKFTANPRPADARGVELFLSAHPGLSSRGYVVCRVSQPEQLTERVAAIGWADL
ncbi:MAG: hypothetical protein HY815_06725 [Candidatus Riflebacteria bacterium]|nr:hypothetical protein [Candidatus Riflebacteria bacterium]